MFLRRLVETKNSVSPAVFPKKLKIRLKYGTFGEPHRISQKGMVVKKIILTKYYNHCI